MNLRPPGLGGNVRVRFALALLALAGFVAVGIALLAVGVWSSAAPADRPMLTRVVGAQVAFLLVAGLIFLGALGLYLSRLFAAYVLPPKRLAAETRLIASVNPDHRLDVPSPPELAGLAAAVNELADRYQGAERDIADRIAAARSELEAERNRLAALMSELTMAVLVCNVEGQILLYNAAARELLDPGRRGYVGLGRSVFGILDRELITHGLDRVRAGGATARLAAATRGDRLLGLRMAPVRTAAGGVGGFVVTAEDLTRATEASEQRDELLRSLTEGTRASLGNIRAAIESMLDYPDMDAEQRQRFAEIIRDEAQQHGEAVERILAEPAAHLVHPWLTEEVLGADLLAAAERSVRATRRLDVRIEEADPELWLAADSLAVVRAVTDLAGRLHADLGVTAVRLSLAASGRYAALDLRWQGPALSPGALREWTTSAVAREVLERHGGEAWSGTADGQAYSRILLPRAAVPEQPPPGSRPPLTVGSRPEFYDFDLFRAVAEAGPAGDQGWWGERPLDRLTFTVFDTETTGLNPSEGDEIVSIGAVRIVNGRLLRQETYEQLVDPHRPVSAASRRVHGISDDMLAGQPPIGAVLPVFARFADSSVLVGHNVAFDLKFLKLKEAGAGVAFTQPVLDTLLLSPVVHPDHADHSLEAIAQRLGVSVLGRHTALGDAILTGEVFVRMLGLLPEKGITTLGEAQEAARKTYQARVSDTLYERS